MGVSWEKINQTSYFLIQFHRNVSEDISLELLMGGLTKQFNCQILLALPPLVQWVLFFSVI